MKVKKALKLLHDNARNQGTRIAIAPVPQNTIAPAAEV